jgi:hypothetical protein
MSDEPSSNPAERPPEPESADRQERRSGPDRRGGGGDRRAELDRRSGADRRSALDRRRGPGRRRTEYRRDAEEGHMNEEQLDFLKAMEEYKRVNDRPYPTLTEVLDIILYLGYRKVAPIGEFKLSKGRQTPRRAAEGALDDESDDS